MALTGWLTDENLKTYWRNAPTDENVLADVVEASRARCLSHLAAEGLDAPAEDGVTGRQRLAQAKFARFEYESQMANADADEVGTDPFSTPLYRLETQAKRLLGYGSLGLEQS